MFVDWPADAFPAWYAPIVIGIVGADPFGSAIDDTVRDKRIDERPLVVKRLDWAAGPAALSHPVRRGRRAGHRRRRAPRRRPVRPDCRTNRHGSVGGTAPYQLQDRGQRSVSTSTSTPRSAPADDQLQAVEPCTDRPQIPDRDRRHMTVCDFRTLSIKGKLMLITMLTSSVALLLASAGFLVYDLVAFRARMSQDLMTQAEIIGANSMAALAFHDERAVRRDPCCAEGQGRDGRGGSLYAGRGTLCRLPAGRRAAGRAAAVRRAAVIISRTTVSKVFQAVVLHGASARHAATSCPTCSTGTRASNAIRPLSCILMFGAAGRRLSALIATAAPSSPDRFSIWNGRCGPCRARRTSRCGRPSRMTTNRCADRRLQRDAVRDSATRYGAASRQRRPSGTHARAGAGDQPSAYGRRTNSRR